jgi:hypothetical protein
MIQANRDRLRAGYTAVADLLSHLTGVFRCDLGIVPTAEGRDLSRSAGRAGSLSLLRQRFEPLAAAAVALADGRASRVGLVIAAI